MTATQAQILLRGGTYAAWQSSNPVLAAREIAAETDTGKFKIGDGVTTWRNLAYSSGVQGPTNSLHYLFLYRFYI
jgi:hypothetical protein